MSKFVLKDAYIELDGDDVSDHVSSVTIDTKDDEVDVTSFGARNKETQKGLGEASIELDAYNDFEAASLDSILWALYEANEPFSVIVRPTPDAASTSNPEYELAEALLFNHQPINGKVGEAATTKVMFKNAGQAGLTRNDGSS